MKDIDLIKRKLNDFKCDDSCVVDAISNIESQLDLLEKLQETLYNSDLHLVYKHTSPTGKIYIGITKNLPNARWNEGSGYETQRKFYKAIQTFGWINFKHEIIAAGLTEDEAKQLESKLILEFKSNQEEYGYNTQVLSNQRDKIEENETEKDQNPRTQIIDYMGIANKLIETFSIKTISGTIYYLSNDKYIVEKHSPILKKELLITYGIPPRKHQEIIEHIKILSFANKSEINFTANIHDTTLQPVSSNISSFLSTLTLDESTNFFISDDDFYENYLIWSREQNLDNLSKTDFLRKSPQWINKYRLDIQRVVTSKIKGWEMKTVVMEETSGKVITQKGLKVISDWLDNTPESMICIPMICELALDIKRSRKLSNELCYVMRNLIPDWNEVGVVHTQKYGNQLCFKRG